MVNHYYNSAAKKKKKKTFVQYYQLLPKLSKCCFLLYKPISPSMPIKLSKSFDSFEVIKGNKL